MEAHNNCHIQKMFEGRVVFINMIYILFLRVFLAERKCFYIQTNTLFK